MGWIWIRRTTAVAALLSFLMAGTAMAKGWQNDGDRWWYQNEDNTYPTSQWQEIGNSWYHFDKDGYMQTGWKSLDSKFYYFDEDGKMARNSYRDRWYLGDDGARITGMDITKIGKASVENQLLFDAGNSLRYLPPALIKSMVDGGWRFQYVTDKESFGSVGDGHDSLYYRYFSMNTSKKMLYFCEEEALLPAIGEYVNLYFGRPAKETEAFMETVSMEWDSLVELMDQEPVLDKSQSMVFAEVFALYYGVDTWERMRDDCPETYRYMTEFALKLQAQ